MTSNLQQVLRPWSYGLATTLTALTGVAVVVLGIVAIVSGGGRFGLMVGLALIIYGAIMLAVVWAALRRFVWAWGLLVATALLNAFTVGSFLQTRDTGQLVGAALVLLAVLVTGIAAIMPSTRLAMQRGRR
jgi:hypothetical protein